MKLTAIGLAVGAPFLARGLMPVMSPLAEYRVERANQKARSDLVKSSDAQREERQRRYEEANAERLAESRALLDESLRNQARKLEDLFAAPQKVTFAGDQYLVLENLLWVRLYGMNLTENERRNFKRFAIHNVVGKEVEIRLPDSYREILRADLGDEGAGILDLAAAGYTPRDQLGQVHALVFFDGRLIYLDYCKSQYRATLLAYQEAYDREKP